MLFRSSLFLFWVASHLSVDEVSNLCYITIVRETGREPPPFPSFYFMKPNTSVWDHDANVRIPKIAQDDQADYEGELVRLLDSSNPFSCFISKYADGTVNGQCLILGRDAKDVSIDDALDYVGAWTAGNDISSRKLQSQPHLAGKMPQFGFSKSFDTYAPMGPVLVAGNLIDDPKSLRITTKIDGQVRQDESVSDLDRKSVV